MASSSPVISHNRTFISLNNSISTHQSYPNLPIFVQSLPSLLLTTKFTALSTSKFTVSSVAKTTSSNVELKYDSNLRTPPNNGWSEFASKVSGEWDGFGADFTPEGKPIELPESVVPGAYREWEVQVFDWQTQCPTLANPENFNLSYRSIQLLPTVGCEADAATVYSSDLKTVGPVENNKILAFAYQNTGCYVSVWAVKETEVYKELELEFCLIDPRDKESRVRVIQIVRLQGKKMKLMKIMVFCEQWYGPFRNGDQLGGCAIRDSGFAATAPLNVSDVGGSWQSLNALATYHNSHNELLQELRGSSTETVIRDEHDLIALPRQLWYSLKEEGNGETYAEVGWLLNNGFAISSRCIFSSDSQIKEIVVSNQTAAMN